MLILTRRALGSLLLGSAVSTAARALPAPVGKPILTVSGQVGEADAEGTVRFDRDMLEALGTEEFQTTTPWYSGPVRFEGVRMSKLMQVVGARGRTVTAVALNDYTTELPMSDFDRFGTLLAIKRDGNYMPVRDKGPLFIIYPFDSLAELKAQQYYGRSAWQVAKLIVK